MTSRPQDIIFFIFFAESYIVRNSSIRFIIQLTYICIVKYKKATKSFYLGNESKLKSQLQQFYLDDLNTKIIDYLKDEVKMIVSNVISDFINPRTKSIFTESPKLNLANVLDKYYESNLWEHWRSI